MDWISLLGAVGVGAIATKLLDVLWLQRILHQSERRKWLREQRLKAYRRLTRELVTNSLWLSDTREREMLKLVADCMLLSTDTKLLKLLETYVPKVLASRRELDRFVNNGTSTVDERSAMREREMALIGGKSLHLVEQLRSTLIG